MSVHHVRPSGPKTEYLVSLLFCRSSRVNSIVVIDNPEIVMIHTCRWDHNPENAYLTVSAVGLADYNMLHKSVGLFICLL